MQSRHIKLTFTGGGVPNENSLSYQHRAKHLTTSIHLKKRKVKKILFIFVKPNQGKNVYKLLLLLLEEEEFFQVVGPDLEERS